MLTHIDTETLTSITAATYALHHANPATIAYFGGEQALITAAKKQYRRALRIKAVTQTKGALKAELSRLGWKSGAMKTGHKDLVSVGVLRGIFEVKYQPTSDARIGIMLPVA